MQEETKRAVETEFGEGFRVGVDVDVDVLVVVGAGDEMLPLVLGLLFPAVLAGGFCCCCCCCTSELEARRPPSAALPLSPASFASHRTVTCWLAVMARQRQRKKQYCSNIGRCVIRRPEVRSWGRSSMWDQVM